MEQLVGKRWRTGDYLLEQKKYVALQRFNFGAVRLYSFRNSRRRLPGMNPANLVNSPRLTRSRPSGNTKRLWLGISTTLWTTADGGRRPVQITGLGVIDAGFALRHHNDGLVLRRVN